MAFCQLGLVLKAFIAGIIVLADIAHIDASKRSNQAGADRSPLPVSTSLATQGQCQAG
jgi:hypothetical protein